MRERRETYVDFDVEVLQVESVLPDIDTDDGDVSEERVLVSGSGNLETLSGGVQTLQSAYSQLTWSERFRWWYRLRASPIRIPGYQQW